eukprot:gene22659-biopygen23755
MWPDRVKKVARPRKKVARPRQKVARPREKVTRPCRKDGRKKQAAWKDAGGPAPHPRSRSGTSLFPVRGPRQHSPRGTDVHSFCCAKLVVASHCLCHFCGNCSNWAPQAVKVLAPQAPEKLTLSAAGAGKMCCCEPQASVKLFPSTPGSQPLTPLSGIPLRRRKSAEATIRRGHHPQRPPSAEATIRRGHHPQRPPSAEATRGGGVLRTRANAGVDLIQKKRAAHAAPTPPLPPCYRCPVAPLAPCYRCPVAPLPPCYRCPVAPLPPCYRCPVAPL